MCIFVWGGDPQAPIGLPPAYPQTRCMSGTSVERTHTELHWFYYVRVGGGGGGDHRHNGMNTLSHLIWESLELSLRLSTRMGSNRLCLFFHTHTHTRTVGPAHTLCLSDLRHVAGEQSSESL